MTQKKGEKTTQGPFFIPIYKVLTHIVICMCMLHEYSCYVCIPNTVFKVTSVLSVIFYENLQKDKVNINTQSWKRGSVIKKHPISEVSHLFPQM